MTNPPPERGRFVQSPVLFYSMTGSCVIPFDLFFFVFFCRTLFCSVLIRIRLLADNEPDGMSPPDGRLCGAGCRFISR